MNMVIPICLRGGGGRCDVPQLRPQDISYVVSAILHAMNPPANKTQPLTAQAIKSFSEMRSGSIAPGKEPKKPTRLPQSTYQVAFLGNIITPCNINWILYTTRKKRMNPGQPLQVSCPLPWNLKVTHTDTNMVVYNIQFKLIITEIFKWWHLKIWSS